MTRQSLNSLVLMRPAAGNVRHQGRHKPLRAVKERLLPRLLLPRLLLPRLLLPRLLLPRLLLPRLLLPRLLLPRLLLPRLLLPRLLQSLQLPDVHRAPVGFEWLVIGIERVR